VSTGVERLARSRRDSLFAAIGPCIGPCCFEVGRDVAETIARASHGANVVAGERGDKGYVDLRAAVRAQLVAAGVSDAHIEDVPGCTKHETARFHSFRRDGGNSGRMLAAIAARRST
jgi:purine-nucleoside/S-methyl-5'-thioadenosine phosphorylase / adenosine deaminase